ncbi:ABC transporter substrate-binding protein [Leisingera sp. HS039]|uniref:ABC transporter substrate-binding protein n=1 Tax=unclassified Leisingera TaxID=2614906 RepID=UPI00107125CD|nr:MULTISPECIES: ABC transporter substrate-binding protein [unclassified Leisingera]MBQ4824543.1 ABC transporter substrate-binding protein [Leisingera sp. HS039]QBR38775.1 ABC transporter substrate-binding protein [Leisingera sp. NJS201]
MKDKTQLANLTAVARTGNLSRRDFVRSAVAAGLAIPAAAGLWTTAAQAAPQRGGTLRLGQHDGNTTDNHDPGTYVSVASIVLAHTHRSYLTQINPDNTLGGDLATSWSASEDAAEWTFELTENASFHSGKPLVADDIIASLNYHRGEDSTSAAKSLLADVVEIVKNNDHSLTIKMASGNADLPWLLTDYHLAIVPARADGTADWESGDGTGPYKIDNVEFGVSASLSRHDGWHLEGAYFDAVEMTIINDPTALQNALLTGAVDVASQLDLKTLALLSRNKDIEVDNIPSAAAVTLPMHVDAAPFDNPDVRLALKYAINRQEIVDKIFFGAATLGNDSHVSPNMPYYADMPLRPYDPDKSKFHLKKAGMDRLDVDLNTADGLLPGSVDLCVLYAEQAQAGNIDINVVRRPTDGYWSQVWLKEPFSFVTWGARPTPDVMFSLAYKDDAAWNESRWNNPRFNELLRAAKIELDDARRTEMYAEMQQLSHDEGGTILPVFNNWVYGRRANVARTENAASSWPVDGARGVSRWWFT